MMKKILSCVLALAVLLCGAAVAEGTAAYTPGTYTGVGTGMDGDVQVNVTFSADAITEITIGEQNESSGICEAAFEQIPAEVIAYQSLGVDSVSGATITSAAVKSAIADAVQQAGGDADALRKVEVPSKAVDGEYDYDVVVAGAGLAGLMGAYEAATEGAHVALIEKTGIVGGTSVTAFGSLACAETADSVEPMIENWRKKNASTTRHDINEAMVRNLCEMSPDVIKLLESSGVEYEIKTNDAGSQTFYATPNEASVKNAAAIKLASKDASAKGGAQLIAALRAACEKAGVDLYLNTPATSLLTDESGAVVGVMSETEKYGKKTFNAKAVVLTTGDYAKNAEMTAEICPRSAGEYSATAVGNTGDGVTMALAVGGVLDSFQEPMSGVFVADPFNMPTVGDKTNSYPFEAVVTNMAGERVFKEDGASHAQKIYYVREDGLNTGWCVMDQGIADHFVNLDEYLQKTEAGSPFIKAYKASSLEELAGLMNVPAETLTATVEAYNKACEAGEDAEFGKAAEYLSAIDDGAYYAVLLYDGTRGNYGGILTNTDNAVVNADGNAIVGLYAGGVISSGSFYADYYPGGEALAVASHMGYNAGRNAAAFAATK